MYSNTQLINAEAATKAASLKADCAMFAAGDPAQAGTLAWSPKKRILELTLTEDGQTLFGEVARARFAALAASMRAETKVIQP